jgi:CRP/FNR family cyclic AMP-dependent transcriptional regulator
MTLTLNLGNVLGFLGIVFCIASFLVKRMLHLRALAIVSNICFLGYGLAEWLLPSVVLNAFLLPLNARRLWEIDRMSKEIARASQSSPVSEWLLPHMLRRAFTPGQELLRRGDAATRLIYIASGSAMLPEIGKRIGAGELLGEIGVFSPDHCCTQTVVGETAGEIYEMTGEQIYQLCYQNPKLGFFLIRLVTQRLLRDLERRPPPATAAV